MIFGRPGSGKSECALRLHLATGYPLYHLDKYFYEANWKEREYQEFLNLQQKIVENESWIIDGNSIKSLEMRYARADVVLYFNFPRLICYFRVLKRRFNKNPLIDDRALGCGETIRWSLLKYMWDFEHRVCEQILKLKNRYPKIKFYEISSNHNLALVEEEILENVKL